MTVSQARKILGKIAIGVSDEVLEKDIQSAQLLFELFRHLMPKHLSKLKAARKKTLNMP